MGVIVTELERAIASSRDSFPVFAGSSLKIKDKQGQFRTLGFNKAQWYVHDQLERQKARLHYVRALVLKGRQQGISTYIGGRFYHRTVFTPGTSTLIMAHEAKATANLFKMVKRYDEGNPFAPAKAATNAQELIFGAIGSDYRVATAGAADTGRSLTAQLFHGSEFAFWQNAQEHLAGIGNAIGDVPGTEIILESTGNGLGNAFHQLWLAAEAGMVDFVPIFVPWYWQPEYALPVPDGFQLANEDEAYRQAYGLSMEQMVFRQRKIATYGQGFEYLFDQEYPATSTLAFQSPTANPLISPITVARAMRSTFRDRYGSFVIGCDPAEFGDDRTAIVFRHGRVVFRIEAHSKKGPMEVAGMLARLWLDMRPDALIVDRIGIGSGIVDRLKEQQIPVIGLNSAERAENAEVYGNRRAEMWWRMKEWLEDSPNRMPNDMAMASDLSAPGFYHTSNGLKMVEKKEDMRDKRKLRSPDLADALALTFATGIAPAEHGGGHHSQGSAGAPPASPAGY